MWKREDEKKRRKVFIGLGAGRMVIWIVVALHWIRGACFVGSSQTP